MEPKTDTLLRFFRALADENRLKIVGLLAQQARSVDELAAMLGLTPPTVSHHLARLLNAGLVEAQAQQYYSVYSLRARVLRDMAQEILTTEKLAESVQDVDQDAFSKKVLTDFLVRGRLKAIPSQLKKRQVILQWLVRKFDQDRNYPERRVNEILKACHEDFATLRRELVDAKLLTRKDGLYWRP